MNAQSWTLVITVGATAGLALLVVGLASTGARASGGGDTGDTGFPDPEYVSFSLSPETVPVLDLPDLSSTAIGNIASFAGADPPPGTVDLSPQVVEVEAVLPEWQALIDAERRLELVRSRVVQVDLEAAAEALGTDAGTVKVKVFDDMELELKHDAAQLRSTAATWIGTHGPDPYDTVRVTWVGDRLLATTIVEGNTVEIFTLDDDTFAVLELQGHTRLGGTP